MAQGRILASGAVNSTTSIFAASPGISMNESHYLLQDGYESVLHDYMKRDFGIGLLCNDVESVGTVHSFNEQTKIPSNTKAADPKVGFGTTTPNYHDDSALDEDYGRDNWKTCIPRFYASRIQYDFFAKQCALKYSAFSDLMAKDWNDCLVDYTRVKAEHFWNGKSTAVDNNTTGANRFEYTGILGQISSLPANVTAIAPTELIVDALQTKLANMMMRMDYTGMPKVLAMNAATYDLITREEMQRTGVSLNLTTDITPGWQVNAINTYIGKLPVLLTPYIRPVVGATDITHSIVCLNPEMIDRIWWFNSQPQILEFASSEVPNANHRLLTDKGVMSFDNFIVRGIQTGNNIILTKTVPK